MAATPGQIWHTVAGLSGAAAIGLGAYGAHGFRPVSKDKAYFIEAFNRGNLYHMVHTLLLAVAPIARRPNLVGGLASAGILLFSGSCYAMALTERKSSLAMLPPIGGITFIAAWLALAL